MIEAKDIREKIEHDFRSESNVVFTMIDNAISKNDHLNSDRIIRCILFLSNGDIEQVAKYIHAAIIDPRDVMYWAECTHHNQLDKTKMVRDFNMPFEGEYGSISKKSDELIEFTHEIWNLWRLSGYKYIRYRRIDENAVALKPFREINNPQETEEMYSFFEIGDDVVREWADNNDPLLEDFEFLVESGFHS